MEIQNKALLMKQLHKFFSKENIPWVKLVWSLYAPGAPHAQSKRGSFWWKDVFSLVDDYRSITTCQIGEGTSVLFWKDFWQNGVLLCDKYARLFSFVRNEDVTVADFANNVDPLSMFHLPLSLFKRFRNWRKLTFSWLRSTLTLWRRIVGFLFGAVQSSLRQNIIISFLDVFLKTVRCSLFGNLKACPNFGCLIGCS